MNTATMEKNVDCQMQCVDRFISCTKNMPSGCVEDLRLCRESCRLPSKA